MSILRRGLIALLLVAAFGTVACDDGPISDTSGPGGNYAGRPVRNPEENADDYRSQQQGFYGPCAAAWQTYDAAYDYWQSGQVTQQYFLDAEAAYDYCVRSNYP